MGQGQSNASEAGLPIKTSYYELLGVERDATVEEIKKSYRRKALELHPDRNHGNEESATQLFTEIQAAYEVLIDPQERAWYDSHEGAILRGFEPGQEGGESFGYNIKLTTSDDVSRFMGAFHGRKIDYDNVPTKFFSELAGLFEKLASEESTAAKMEGAQDPEYSPFGVREDDYELVVKPFYSAWSGFSTQKTYFWEDKYNLTEAQDRRVRRLMEKENKKSRDDAIRDFNDTVRMLVAFVRKRDPRYKPNFQTEAERQQALRDASAAQAARSRAAHAAKINVQVPEWAQVQETQDEIESEEDEEDVVSDQFECVACRKTFKSEKQFEAHERSKKHHQSVKSLVRKMKKENEEFNLDQQTTSEGKTAKEDSTNKATSADDDDFDGAKADLDLSTDSGTVIPEDDAPIPGTGLYSQSHSESGSESESDIDDEYASREQVLSHSSETSSAQNSESRQQEPQPKIGKAAQKRARKAAQRVEAEKEEDRFKCAKCSAAFPSRTRLFDHLKDFGHAAPVKQIKPISAKKKEKRWQR